MSDIWTVYTFANIWTDDDPIIGPYLVSVRGSEPISGTTECGYHWSGVKEIIIAEAYGDGISISRDEWERLLNRAEQMAQRLNEPREDPGEARPARADRE